MTKIVTQEHYYYYYYYSQYRQQGDRSVWGGWLVFWTYFSRIDKPTLGKIETVGTIRDTMILHILCHTMIDLGKSLTVVFVDYSTSFDSVSHKFMDTALKEAGVSTKVREIVRVIYKSTSTFTSVKGTDNK